MNLATAIKKENATISVKRLLTEYLNNPSTKQPLSHPLQKLSGLPSKMQPIDAICQQKTQNSPVIPPVLHDLAP